MENLVIDQHSSNPIYIRGWYGTDDHCSPFLLRTLEDVLYIVSTTSPNSTSRAIYTPTAPDDTQLFSKLECGHWYEIVLKPGNTKGITIPGFIPNNLARR